MHAHLEMVAAFEAALQAIEEDSDAWHDAVQLREEAALHAAEGGVIWP